MTSQRRQLPNRRGAIVVLSAICLAVVVAFLAFSVDYGYLVVTQGELQNAADAGALSGAKGLAEGRDVAIAAAQDWAGRNVAAARNVAVVASEDVEVGYWDEDTATFTPLPLNSPQSPNAVRVTCRRTAARGNPVSLFFASFFGRSEAALEVSAIGLHHGGSCGGIMALNRVYLRENSYTDSFDSSVGDYSVGPIGDNGDVCTNGHIRLLHFAGINGDAHPGPEETGVEMGGTNYVTGEIEILDDYIDFPAVNLGNVAMVNDNSNIPLTRNGNNALNNGSLEMDGGAGGPDVLDLPPGTYYFTGLDLYGGSQIRVTGPTYIYIAGDVDLIGGGIVNTTLRPMNLQIYPLGTRFWLPNDTDLYAVIYSTTSAIEKAGGSGGFFGKMVGQKIKINGSGGLHVDDSVIFGDLRSGGEQLGTSQGASLVY